MVYTEKAQAVIQKWLTHGLMNISRLSAETKAKKEPAVIEDLLAIALLRQGLVILWPGDYICCT